MMVQVRQAPHENLCGIKMSTANIKQLQFHNEVAAVYLLFESYGFSDFITFTPRKVNSLCIICDDTNYRNHLW